MGSTPTTLFAWPVPPEELAALQVLILEWGADGRVTVRQDPGIASAEPAPVRPRPAPIGDHRVVHSRLDAAVAAPLRIRLAGPPVPGPGRAVLRQPARDRVTWFGIGTLIGLTLAASALPDSSTVAGTRRAYVDRPTESDAAPTIRPAAALLPPVPQPASASRQPRADARPSRAAAAAVATPRAPARTPKPRPSPADTAAVLGEVRRYEAAYTRMDASATQAVWPGADREALVRHFTGLREQRLQLERCVVETPEGAASATCRGTLRYRPRVGEHSTRTQRGTWRFALDRRGDAWVIASVTTPVVERAGGPATPPSGGRAGSSPHPSPSANQTSGSSPFR